MPGYVKMFKNNDALANHTLKTKI